MAAGNTVTVINMAGSEAVPAFETLALTPSLVRDLRSDHAGETGAVAIYQGILAVSRDPEVRAFALRHLQTERAHLAFFDRWLPAATHSRLLPLWPVAGWLTGALPALFGRRAVFRTIEAVEQFVETHYLEQVAALTESRWRPLRETLTAFCAEEVEHRDEAGHLAGGAVAASPTLWQRIVGAGSAAGVALARRL